MIDFTYNSIILTDHKSRRETSSFLPERNDWQKYEESENKDVVIETDKDSSSEEFDYDKFMKAYERISQTQTGISLQQATAYFNIGANKILRLVRENSCIKKYIIDGETFIDKDSFERFLDTVDRI